MHDEERKAAKIAVTFSIITALLIICFQTLFAYQVVLATLRVFLLRRSDILEPRPIQCLFP